MKNPSKTSKTNMAPPEKSEQRQEEEHTEPFKNDSDIFQQLMDRYAKSAAPQHCHLLATAAAMRSILVSESLPLTPPSYFAATISAVADSQTLDSTAIAALLSLLAIVLPLVPPQGIVPPKASEAVEALVGLVEREKNGLAVSSLRAGVKCVGILLEFSDLEVWGSVKLGFQTLLKFSVDKRPKVRRCAQDCLEKIFKSFQSSTIIKEASKLVFCLFKSYMPLAVKLSTANNADSRDELLSKPEHLEVLHMLNILKLIVPFLSVKVSSKILLELHKLMSSQLSALTRHIHDIIKAFFESSSVEVIIPESENIIISLVSFVSLGVENPVDTLMPAALLLKCVLDKVHAGASSLWIKNLPFVCGSIAGLLTSEAGTASQASSILKELINHHLDKKNFSINGNQQFEDESEDSMEASAIKSTCAIFENVLNGCDGIPNEHILAVISVLFLKLGEVSSIFMKNIVLKLADLMTLSGVGTSNAEHHQSCIGSAVIAMGPERILTLLPISLNADNFTCSNIWLVPIFKNYVVGASLGYYLEHIVPLAKAFQLASRKVKKSVSGEDLQAHAHGLWGLLPAFCRYPTDTSQMFGPLAELLISFLKKDSFMHENIAVALQVLVNQNRSALRLEKEVGESNSYSLKDSVREFIDVPAYSKKTATRNIRALASCSTELLQALMDLFMDSLPGKRSYLKDAIGCLAAITDSSVRKNIFVSLLLRFQFSDGAGELEKLGSQTHELIEKEEDNLYIAEKDVERCVILELASSLVVGAKADLIDIIYDFIRKTFQATNESGHREAYHTLCRILEEHTWFCSARFVELIDLLLGLKSPLCTASLRSRFASFHILMVHSLKTNLDEENTKAFLILNEIILTLKDASEEVRKAAYDILLTINSSLRNSTCVGFDSPQLKLISMILGYISGSSPRIKSGAVSALSVLIYKDSEICLSMPDLVPSLLTLLQSKALEVIKAALGFVKVLVSCLQAKDLQNLLSDVVNGVLPWSSVSRHHFRSKVTVILEIAIRKCGSAAVDFVSPGKYKGFIKTVLENRHNKTNSTEAGTTDKEIMVADSSTKRDQKRKREELATSNQGNDSVEHKKRKREKKHNVNAPSLKELCTSTGSDGGLKWAKKARDSSQEKSMKGLSEGNGNKNRRNFNKGTTYGGKGKMGRSNVSRKDEGVIRKPAITSTLHKHKGGRKWQKTKK